MLLGRFKMNIIRIEREPDFEYVKRAYKWNFRGKCYEKEWEDERAANHE